MRHNVLFLSLGMGIAVLAGLSAQAIFGAPAWHHVSSPADPDSTRARLVSYAEDGTVVYWADVPPGTAEIQITIKGAHSIGSVHVVQAVSLGGMYCKSQSDGTCK